MSDNIVIFPDLNAPDAEHIYVDDNGNKWQRFSISFRHESVVESKREQSFSFDIWALDHEDAERRLESIRQNAKVDGGVMHTEEWGDD